MNNTSEHTNLILGGTGKTGRRIVERLEQRDVPVRVVDTDDIADVATAALTEPGHEGQVYELTGPRLLTFGDAVAEIAAAIERPVAFTSVDVADYAQAMREQGLPEDVIALISYLF